MEDYHPTSFTPLVSETGDISRGNQEIWNLVGLDPIINKIHETYSLIRSSAPIGAEIDEAAGNLITKVLVPMEVKMYDLLTSSHTAPSKRFKNLFSNMR